MLRLIDNKMQLWYLALLYITVETEPQSQQHTLSHDISYSITFNLGYFDFYQSNVSTGRVLNFQNF